MARQIPAAELAEQIRAGSRAHIARAITLVESTRPDHRARARELLSLLTPDSGKSLRVGISGVPGAGKSTLIDALGVRLVDQGRHVAVLAVDPSSSRTGGSVLGDRTRMAALTGRSEAFVRPSPTGNHLGGVARATRESMIIVEAAGFDVVIVETVGVGQSEVAVSEMVDTFLLIALARSGDQLQGIKRGILEIADVIAVNKADGEHAGEARVAARDLSIAMKLVGEEGKRRPPVLTCSAHTGDGLDELWAKVVEHREWLEAHDLTGRRAQQQLTWLWALVDGELKDALRRSDCVAAVRGPLEAEVAAGRISALEASQEIVAALIRDLAP